MSTGIIVTNAVRATLPSDNFSAAGAVDPISGVFSAFAFAAFAASAFAFAFAFASAFASAFLSGAVFAGCKFKASLVAGVGNKLGEFRALSVIKLGELFKVSRARFLVLSSAAAFAASAFSAFAASAFAFASASAFAFASASSAVTSFFCFFFGGPLLPPCIPSIFTFASISEDITES